MKITILLQLKVIISRLIIYTPVDSICTYWSFGVNKPPREKKKYDDGGAATEQANSVLWIY